MSGFFALLDDIATLAKLTLSTVDDTASMAVKTSAKVSAAAVDDVTTLQARLDDKNVGDVVVLLVERAGKTREMLVELQPGV